MDERLEQLVRAVQQMSDRPEEQSPVVSQLVDEILRSRKIGRSPKGQPLAGIHRVIYERVRQQLWEEVLTSIQPLNVDRDAVRVWSQSLLTQAFHITLRDEDLKQLALEAQRHPVRSADRSHALTQLIEAIRLSGRLARPHREKFSPAFYDLLYDEAVSRTLTYVCRQIDHYDPERGQAKKFMNWVNFRLDREVIECRRLFTEREVQELPDLNDLDSLAQVEPVPSTGDLVRDCIDQDVDQVFRKAHIRDRPDANFRAIALARLNHQSWEEISAEFGIKVPTLSSFFQRCCDKFAPKFQEYLST